MRTVCAPITQHEMKITSPLFEAGLKCTTKCFLRSLGETGTGSIDKLLGMGEKEQKHS